MTAAACLVLGVLLVLRKPKRLRQNRRQFGRASTLVRMLAPVVVNPEIVSNSASAREGIWPLIQKGRAPKKLSTTQINH